MLRSERPSGDFELNVRLPSEVDAVTVVAQMRDGVLDVRLPGSKGARGRSIDVEEGSETQPDEPGAQADG
jgi:HSP20 family molecular chaperone IbpA